MNSGISNEGTFWFSERSKFYEFIFISTSTYTV